VADTKARDALVLVLAARVVLAARALPMQAPTAQQYRQRASVSSEYAKRDGPEDHILPCA